MTDDVMNIYRVFTQSNHNLSWEGLCPTEAASNFGLSYVILTFGKC